MQHVTGENAAEVARVTAAFLKPFDASEVKIKPAMVKGNRCLALHYIDARLVMDRLDEVVGVNNWQDEYIPLPSGAVECRLRVRIAGEWITKADVGGKSEQPDEDDQTKAAYSDALKRAAVKFGIGRFLYRMAQQWMDYDPIKKQVIRSGAAAGTKAPAPQQKAAPAKPLAQQCIDAIGAVKSRGELTPIYRQFEADAADGRFTDAEHTAIKAAFTAAGKKYPAPQPAR